MHAFAHKRARSEPARIHTQTPHNYTWKSEHLPTSADDTVLTNTGAHTRVRASREAPPSVTFTTRHTLYPEGLDLIHGLKVAYVVCGQISEQHTVITRYAPLHWPCTLNTARISDCLQRYSKHVTGIIFISDIRPHCVLSAILQVYFNVPGRPGEALVVPCCRHFLCTRQCEK